MSDETKSLTQALKGDSKFQGIGRVYFRKNP